MHVAVLAGLLASLVLVACAGGARRTWMLAGAATAGGGALGAGLAARTGAAAIPEGALGAAAAVAGVVALIVTILVLAGRFPARPAILAVGGAGLGGQSAMQAADVWWGAWKPLGGISTTVGTTLGLFAGGLVCWFVGSQVARHGRSRRSLLTTVAVSAGVAAHTATEATVAGLAVPGRHTLVLRAPAPPSLGGLGMGALGVGTPLTAAAVAAGVTILVVATVAVVVRTAGPGAGGAAAGGDAVGGGARAGDGAARRGARLPVWAWAGALAGAVVLGVAALAEPVAGHTGQVAVATGYCTASGAPRAGSPSSFLLVNAGGSTAAVALEDATGVRLAPLATAVLGAGSDQRVAVAVPPGTYRWVCTAPDGARTLSALSAVGGAPEAAPAGLAQVPPTAMLAPVAAYRAYVTAGLAHLVADTDALQAAVRAGNRTGAQLLWLPAHLDYESLGAAYGTFGAFDGEINGRADGLPGGVDDAGFTGFLRLEYGLWHDLPMPALAPVADALDVAVRGLQSAFPTMTIPATDLPLRAHEILENALQFELTGQTDEGSHTNLATVAANIRGTQEVLSVLHGLLTQRIPLQVPGIEGAVDALAAGVAGYDHGGAWVPLEDLTRTQRAQIDALMDAALEQLSVVPGSLVIQGSNT